MPSTRRSPARPKPPQKYAKLKKLSPQERAALLEALLDAPSAYEEANRKSGHGLRIPLPGGGAFWSHGWSGCARCRQRVDIPVLLQPFVARQPEGWRKGWVCQP